MYSTSERQDSFASVIRHAQSYYSTQSRIGKEGDVETGCLLCRPHDSIEIAMQHLTTSGGDDKVIGEPSSPQQSAGSMISNTFGSSVTVILKRHVSWIPAVESPVVVRFSATQRQPKSNDTSCAWTLVPPSSEDLVFSPGLLLVLVRTAANVGWLNPQFECDTRHSGQSSGFMAELSELVFVWQALQCDSSSVGWPSKGFPVYRPGGTSSAVASIEPLTPPASSGSIFLPNGTLLSWKPYSLNSIRRDVVTENTGGVLMTGSKGAVEPKLEPQGGRRTVLQRTTGNDGIRIEGLSKKRGKSQASDAKDDHNLSFCETNNVHIVEANRCVRTLTISFPGPHETSPRPSRSGSWSQVYPVEQLSSAWPTPLADPSRLVQIFSQLQTISEILFPGGAQRSRNGAPLSAFQSLLETLRPMMIRQQNDDDDPWEEMFERQGDRNKATRQGEGSSQKNLHNQQHYLTAVLFPTIGRSLRSLLHPNCSLAQSRSSHLGNQDAVAASLLIKTFFLPTALRSSGSIPRTALESLFLATIFQDCTRPLLGSKPQPYFSEFPKNQGAAPFTSQLLHLLKGAVQYSANLFTSSPQGPVVAKEMLVIAMWLSRLQQSCTTTATTVPMLFSSAPPGSRLRQSVVDGNRPIAAGTSPMGECTAETLDDSVSIEIDTCSVCGQDLQGRGAAALVVVCCHDCGHGGHPCHIEDWFLKENQTECPTGCGCQCWGRFAQQK